MPTVRTVFRPFEDLEVDEAEAEQLARMGLLAPGPDTVEEVNSDGSESDEGHGLQGRAEADRQEVGGEPGLGGGDPRVLSAQGVPEGQGGESEPEEGSPEEEG